jgi:spermidine synthase
LVQKILDNKILLILFGISGMAALIYEITWIRPLSLVFGATIYAVSTIVASFILGLALGSWFAGRYSDRMKNPLAWFSYLQIGIGLYGMFLLPIFGLLPGTYFEIYQLTYPNQYFFMFIQVVLSMAIISVPATMMGTTLPIMIRVYSSGFSTIGKDVGKLDASNSVGAVIGTLVAGFFMIPILGIQNTIILTALINIGLGLSIITLKRYWTVKKLTGIAILAIIFVLLVPSYDVQTLNLGIYAHNNLEFSWQDRLNFLDGQKILFYQESPYSTVMVLNDWNQTTRLTINGKTQCSTHPREIQYLQELASIPYQVFVHNNGEPKNILNIGLGCGVTTKWFSERADTTTIEIDPVVAKTSNFFYDKIEHHLIIDDGRNWLLRNEQKFDIISSEPSDPFESKGALFTQEFFILLRDNLSENGIVAQWVPVFEWTPEDITIFYNTFHSVFPYVHIYQMEPQSVQQLVMVGSVKPLKVPPNELYLISSEDIPQFNTVLNTDDKPVLEFSTAWNIYE